MYALVVDQVLGINGLINLSNIVFLVAFSVRDVLKLRILAIVGEGMTLPYYYLQTEKLWPPIFWGAAFMIVNVIRIVAIAGAVMGHFATIASAALSCFAQSDNEFTK
jgi:hypothetical protein